MRALRSINWMWGKTAIVSPRLGRTISLETFKFSTTSGAVTTPVAACDIAAVQLVQRGTGTTLKAILPVVDR